MAKEIWKIVGILTLSTVSYWYILISDILRSPSSKHEEEGSEFDCLLAAEQVIMQMGREEKFDS